MRAPLIRRQLVVKRSAIHGLGVFAEEPITAGDIIEECYTLVSSEESYVKPYGNYYFDHKKSLLLVLGSGSIFNHADVPNAGYEFDEEHSLMIYKALQPIAAGEEIFINYGKDWFSSRKTVAKKPSWRYRCKTQIRRLQIPLRFLLVASILLFTAWFLQNA